jgi:Fe-S-cluster containining protein
VLDVQRTIRTCEGCGLCCTDAYNAVKILPLEARRIVRHLEGLPRAVREDLLALVEQAVARYRLRADGPKIRYTCPFLEPNLGCALPLHVKPTACLSFNPVDPDRCEQEPEWYFPAHDREEAENREAGLAPEETPLPVAVLAAHGDGTGRAGEDSAGHRTGATAAPVTQERQEESGTACKAGRSGPRWVQSRGRRRATPRRRGRQ